VEGRVNRLLQIVHTYFRTKSSGPPFDARGFADEVDAALAAEPSNGAPRYGL